MVNTSPRVSPATCVANLFPKSAFGVIVRSRSIPIRSSSPCQYGLLPFDGGTGEFVGTLPCTVDPSPGLPFVGTRVAGIFRNALGMSGLVFGSTGSGPPVQGT
jgi:hypothetical protein